MNNELKEKLIKSFKTNRKLVIILIIGLCGILLIFISETDNKSDVNEESVAENDFSSEDYSLSLEKRLKELLSSIEGAGEVNVMVTLKSSDENVYAVNENIKNDENSKTYTGNYVILDNKNSKEGIRLKVKEPEVLGVAVVCSGGDDPKVVSQITYCVSALLGIGSNKISVSKMK